MGQSILHLADLHLGASHDYLGSRGQERAREADGVLDRLAEWIAMAGAGSRDIAAILIAGDLFDCPTPPDPFVMQVIRALRRIESAGIRVVTVPGNHDEWTYPNGVFRRYESTWPGTLVRCAAPEIVETLELEGGMGVEIVSCAFHQGRNPRPDDWTSPFANPPEEGTRRVGLFHGTLDRVGEYLAGGERAFRLDLDRLASWGIDYLALGHIHKRQEFRSGACHAIYPGPIEGKGFDDPGAGELTLIDFTQEGVRVSTCDARALGIRARDVEIWTVDPIGIADAAHLEGEIEKRADAARILRVALTGPCRFAVDFDDITRRLGPRFYHLEIEGDDGAGYALGDWEAISSQRTPAGVFARRVIEARDAEPGGDPRFWDEVAAAGLRALGSRGAR